MTALFIPAPCTGYGPCNSDCVHRDCIWQRTTAASACVLCGQPIGYERHFHETERDVAHTVCIEQTVTLERGTRH